MAVPAITALAFFAGTGLGAANNQIVVTLHEAHAETKDDDNCGPLDIACTEQDFFVEVAPDVAPLQTSPTVDGRDDAAWIQWAPTWSVDNTRRFHGMSIRLWDYDTTSSRDAFDINPDPARNDLNVVFDACFNTWSASPGIPAPQVDVVTTPPGNGSPSGDRGHLKLKISTGDGLPFTPNTLIVTSLGPVQGAEDPRYVISSKPTVMKVAFASTYTAPLVNVPVTVTVTDGLSSWVDGPVPITVPPGLSTVYFFDGSAGHASPFSPFKPSNASTATLTYSATLDHEDIAPPGTPADLLDCYQVNHSLIDKTTPIIATDVPFVLFMLFDYADTFYLPNPIDVSIMAARDETFRRASWPMASTNFAAPGVPFTPPYPAPLFFLEPSATVAGASILANLAHIPKLVLVARNGWFYDNSFRLPWTKPTAAGFSIGEVGPRAVIAEEGHYAVSTHELGHTYGMSQRKCSNGGLAEDWFGVGCRDEYNFPISDGRPFRAEGYDVEGTVFGSAAVDSTVGGCDPSHAGARYVCQANLMDLNSSSGFQNWTDTFTYDLLAERLRRRSDPRIVTLAGYVYSPGWYNATTEPPVFTGALSFSYQTDDIPDVDDPVPAPGSLSASTGSGAFAVYVTLNTGAQKIYRFNPSFVSDDALTPADGAFFSFSVPWDPATTVVELFGPSDVLHLDCDGAACPNQDVLIDRRETTPYSPVVGSLAAGKDGPPVGGDPAPTIGPGHNAVIAWSASDADSVDLRAAVLVGQPGAGGSTEQWWPLALDVTGGSLAVGHDQLGSAPGDYQARVVVSDGINSSELVSGIVFRICNFTNGGIERCDGLDNDCDGSVDNALAPEGSSTVSVSQTAISWSGIASADDYDVVRGDVDLLRASQGDFALSTQECITAQTSLTSVVYSAAPPASVAWWFLVRGHNCSAAGTYDEGDGSQAAPRDGGISGSPASCP